MGGRKRYGSCFVLHASCLIFFPLLLATIAIGDEITDAQSKHLIRQITFEGNEHLDKKALLRMLGAEAGQPYRRAEVMEGLDRITAEYGGKGFVFASLNPEIVPVASDQVHIRIRIDEGQRIRTGKIVISGNQLFPTQELRRELGLREGLPFSQVVFEQGIERILARYSEHGYPRIEIEPTNFQLSPEEGKINLHLQIHEGNQIRIAEVKLSGLKKTRTETVLRELPIQRGEVFDQRKIDQSFHRLVNLGYFYEVSPNLLEEGKPRTNSFFMHE